MKTCPSCNAECDSRVEVCPTCGHSFEEADSPKRTMLGFPSLAAALEEADAQKPEEPAKQTLFGFPAQKGLGDVSEPVEESEAEAATSIIPASAFAFDSGSFSAAPSNDDEDEEDIPPTMEKDLRGTVAGMHIKPAEDYGGDDATEIVSGTAVFPGARPATDDPDDDLRSKGTLMGMSLADVQAQAPPPSSRSTQFAIPAVQAEKMQQATQAPPAIDEPVEHKSTQRMASLRDTSEESPIDDSPTQAWSPGSLTKDDDDGRKKLLEKIRKSRPVADAEAPRAKKRPSSDGPDLSALKNLKPKRNTNTTPVEFPDEDERDTNEQPAAPKSAPASGVLRSAGERRGDSGANRGPGGSGAYSFGPGEAPAQPESLESISDPEFGLAATDIASGELLNQAVEQFSGGNEPAPTPEPPRSPQQTKRAGVYETFDGGSSSDVRAQPSPTQQSAPQQAPPQRSAPQPAPSTPSQAMPARPEPSGEMRQRPYQPPGPQPSPLHAGPMPTPGPQPFMPGQEAPREDPFIRIIQAAFGVAAGVIAVLVQVFVFMSLDSPQNKSIVMMALAVVLGLVAIAAAASPLKSRHRTMAFFGLAVLLFVVGILGKLVVGLPGTFLVVLFSALLAFVTGAFPYLSRLVS